jgi:hypothetical protein
MKSADQLLAKRLGVPVATVTTLREQHLTAKLHYHDGTGPKAHYTAEGEARLRKLLTLPASAESEVPSPESGVEAANNSELRTPNSELNEEPETKNQEPAPPVRLRLLAPLPNRIWIRCATPGPEPKAVNIQVRNNRGLRPGAQILCQQIDGQWRCVQPNLAPFAPVAQ